MTNRTDSLGADPALLARLQATLPDRSGNQTSGSGEEPLRSPYGAHSGSRVQRTQFTSGGRGASKPRESETTKKENWGRAALDAVRVHAWLVLALGFAGVLLGYVYTVRICIPIYRVQASIEIRNNQSPAHTEALAHVLESQSMVNAVLASMPAAERSALVEHSSVPFAGPQDSDAALHQRLEAVPIPSAEVIDISLLSPNRPAAVRFVNGLIEALMVRQANVKPAITQKDITIVPADDADFFHNALSAPLKNSVDRAADEVTIIDPAIALGEPVSPDLSHNLLVAGMSGILAGLVIALFRKFAANTFAGPGSVSQVLGVRELGAIPQRKLLGSANTDNAHAGIQMDANDESLRYLRSSLLYHPGKQQVRSLAFTSAAPGEGKTTVVANLSMSLAATGRRVLVIDGDLRRPRLHKLMQVPMGPGLADLLRRHPSAAPVSLSRFVHATHFANLFVLPPGTSGEDAPELLAGPHLSQLFRELSKAFDFVLIDTPPLLACSDARNYARSVEGVVLVVRSSETQKRAALVARDMLLQDGANILGTVLTGWRQNYPAYSYPSAGNYSKA